MRFGCVALVLILVCCEKTMEVTAEAPMESVSPVEGKSLAESVSVTDSPAVPEKVTAPAPVTAPGPVVGEEAPPESHLSEDELEQVDLGRNAAKIRELEREVQAQESQVEQQQAQIVDFDQKIQMLKRHLEANAKPSMEGAAPPPEAIGSIPEFPLMATPGED